MLKALFVLEIFEFLFCPDILIMQKNGMDKEAKVNFKIYDVTDWTTNDYNK